MKKKIKIFTNLHQSTKRDYIERMMSKKVISMKKQESLSLIIGTAKEITGMGDINLYLENGPQ